MKILYVSSLYTPYEIGGAEQSMSALATNMVLDGHEMHVATLAPRGSDFSSCEQIDGVHVYRAPLANAYWPWGPSRRRPTVAKALWHFIDTSNFLMSKRLIALVHSIRPNIVVTANLQGWSTAVIAAVKSLGLPVAHIVNDYSLLCPQTSLFRNGRGCGVQSDRCTSCKVLTAPRKRHANSVDGVIGVSKSVLDMHMNHGLFTECPSTVIYNPLKDGMTIATEPRIESSSVFTFGYMGRIEKQKGIETLLLAVQRLQNSGVNLRVQIAGRAPSDRYLKSLQTRWPLTNVEYVGYVDSKEFLDRIDCLVFPTSGLEALGNGVFEAFSRGVPVIGSNAGGIPESIEIDRTGFVFEKGDDKSLALLMKKMVREPAIRARMVTAVIKKAREYSPANRMAAHIEFYSKVISTVNATSTEADQDV